MDNSQARPWRSVEELIEIGFQRSRVVMMNEAHAGDLRCIRTRVIGQRILLAAYKMGAHYLAMEALRPEIAEEANRTRQLGEAFPGSYLTQPEMRSFIQAALDMGWTLVDYEADFRLEPPGLSFRRQNNWREEMQARNLVARFNQFLAMRNCLSGAVTAITRKRLFLFGMTKATKNGH